jgi:hypothetical protein
MAKTKEVGLHLILKRYFNTEKFKFYNIYGGDEIEGVINILPSSHLLLPEDRQEFIFGWAARQLVFVHSI